MILRKMSRLFRLAEFMKNEKAMRNAQMKNKNANKRFNELTI